MSQYRQNASNMGPTIEQIKDDNLEYLIKKRWESLKIWALRGALLLVFVCCGLGIATAVLALTASGKVDYCYLAGNSEVGFWLIQHRQFSANKAIEITSPENGVEVANQMNCPMRGGK